MRSTVAGRLTSFLTISFLAVVGSAQAFTWSGPTTVSGTDSAYLNPRVATDANGDVLVAWLQTTSVSLGSWHCPCKIRAAYRPAGGSFQAPVNVTPSSMTSDDSVQQIYLAMAANGDAVVAWNNADTSLPYASIRPAGTNSPWGTPVALGTDGGSGANGISVNEVAMDANGDAIAALNNEQPYTGPDGPADVFNAQVVHRPAGGSFDVAHPQTFGDGAHNTYPRALGMSPDGKAVLTLRVDAFDLSLSPGASVSNAVKVTTSSGPGVAFNTTPTTIQTISNHPQGGLTVYPVLDTGSSTYPMAAIDDTGDYVVTYDDSASDGSDTPKVSLNGAAGVALGTGAIGNGAGPVVIAPTGQAVAFANSGGTEVESVRPAAGAFGSSTAVGNGITFASSIVNAANEASTNGEILLSADALGPESTNDGASIGTAAGVFPAPTTIASNDDNFSFGTQGAIDKSGDAAVTWIGGTTGYQVQVAIGTNAAPPPATHTLSVKRSGSGSGTVTSSPAGINCGSTCSKAFSNGAQVTLTAAAASGSKFSGWSGACSGTGSCKVTLSADQSVTATFSKSASKPNTKITRHKVNKGKRQATFKFTAIGKATGFECALVKLPKKKGHKAPKPKFSRCGSPKTYKHVKSGSYKFEVRAVLSGVADPTPATASFKIKRPGTVLWRDCHGTVFRLDQ